MLGCILFCLCELNRSCVFSLFWEPRKSSQTALNRSFAQRFKREHMGVSLELAEQPMMAIVIAVWGGVGTMIVFPVSLLVDEDCDVWACRSSFLPSVLPWYKCTAGGAEQRWGTLLSRTGSKREQHTCSPQDSDIALHISAPKHFTLLHMFCRSSSLLPVASRWLQ